MAGALLVFAASAAAQPSLRGGASLVGSSMRLNTEGTDGAVRFTGFGVGGNGTLSYGRLSFALRYMEGSLSTSSSDADRDLVEGEAMLSVKAASALTFGFGPHIRSLIRPEGTERWLFWEARVQTRARLGYPQLTSLFALWRAFSADVDVPESFDGGMGLEGMLRWEISALPLWLGVGYRIDRSRLGDGARSEVMEHVVFSVGWGRGTSP